MGPELGQGQGLRPARWLPLGANWPRTAEPLTPGLRGGPARQGTRVHKAKLQFPNPARFFLAFCTASHSRAFSFTPDFFCFSPSESCRVSLGLSAGPLGSPTSPHSSLSTFRLGSSFPSFRLSSWRYLLDRELCLLPCQTPPFLYALALGHFCPPRVTHPPSLLSCLSWLSCLFLLGSSRG